jgi:general secretion pathway protein I
MFGSIGSREVWKLSPPNCSKNRHNVAGFTLVEVLVALAVVAISLTAIGSLVATTTGGTRSIDEHLTLAETARAIETGLPDGNDLKVGSLAGVRNGYRWRVDVLPFRARFIDPGQATPWVPLAVVITVQSPNGPVLRVNTVRLRRRTSS